jgi:universal stress protein A
MKTEIASCNTCPNQVMHFKKVLVPIDFSDCSKQALDYALAFAEQFGSEVTLLNVIPNELTSFEYGEPQAIASQERQKNQSQRNLAQLAEDTLAGSRHNILVKVGKPFEEIVRSAKNLGVDLIIISTHGFPGATRVELGSTTERVVRYATCPVVVVRPPADKPCD